MYANSQKTLTELFEDIYIRLKQGKPEEAEELKELVLEGKVTEEILNDISYVVQSVEMRNPKDNPYLTMGNSVINIYINDDIIQNQKKNQGPSNNIYGEFKYNTLPSFASVLTHEFKHGEYPFIKTENSFNALKWYVIRDKSQKESLYDLGDDLGYNGACSSGPSHERYNPENKYVCEY